MAGKDWNDLGKNLDRIIDDAVNMRNFGHLNDTINRTVKQAFQGFSGSGNVAGGPWDFKLSKDGPETSGQQTYGRAKQQKSSGSYDYGQPQASGEYTYGMSSETQQQSFSSANQRLFAGGGKRKGGAIAKVASGIFCILAAITALVLSFGVFVFGVGNIATGFLAGAAAFCVGGIALILSGVSGLKLSKRFDQYVRCLEGDSYGDISMLSTYTHKPEGFVLKDIRKMLSKGWFTQGHLDQQEKCLIVSDEAYAQYLDTVKNVRIQAEETRRRQEEDARRTGHLTPEAKAVIERGREYIMEIRRSNDEIPGEEVSNKMYHMELLVKRIFEQAEAHPENIADLRKLMDYYLPMTMKLLKAYEDLDKQPIQGENIMSSKKEIEDTLDTLNAAFEKLLDNLFQDTAWDVSSDISVLKTMMAQEGLTEDGLKK